MCTFVKFVECAFNFHFKTTFSYNFFRRPVDRNRARQAQVKKREDLSEIDEDDDSPPGRKGAGSETLLGSVVKKKKKRGKV